MRKKLAEVEFAVSVHINFELLCWCQKITTESKTDCLHSAWLVCMSKIYKLQHLSLSLVSCLWPLVNAQSCIRL